ncbi:hypothetical protein E1262_06995 [Jiangella aurantiaca]|uniref:Uncharacterized protein n=1 Tax=Jiangella aurantiaca TaxID=2530373 RepID=A0A4R5AG13_9ACTN|nr:hypothetical protein [Jiangella aurantiaca]TDD71341.1 hypothetical protein E1262_06995 [Jiangella aurantiaca]
MVTAPRTVLRNLVAALLAAGLVVLAAAMVTGGGDTVRGLGPAIHPAAEITPNSLPRADDDQHPLDEVARHTPDDGATSAGDHAGPDSAAVVGDAAPGGAARTGTDRVHDTTARHAASAPTGTVDGRAPPEPGAR